MVFSVGYAMRSLSRLKEENSLRINIITPLIPSTLTRYGPNVHNL